MDVVAAVLFLTGFCVVALGLLTWVGAQFFLTPPWHVAPKPNEPLTDKWLPAPWKGKKADPLTDYEVDFEDVYLITQHVDGPHALRGWYLPVENQHKHKFTDRSVVGGAFGRVGVIAVHGGGRDRRAWVRHAPSFLRRGLSMLLFDCSGHGQSATPRGQHYGMSYGVRESRDVVAAAKWMREKGFQCIVAMGTSNGAVATIMAAAGEDGSLLDIIIAENPFLGVTGLVRHVLGNIHGMLPWWLQPPTKPVFWILKWTVPLVARLRLSHVHKKYKKVIQPSTVTLSADDEEWQRKSYLRADDFIGAVSQPLLLMHATGDKLAPHTHSEELFAGATQPKELWIVDGSAHTALWDSHPDQWESRVFEFIKKHVQERRTQN